MDESAAGNASLDAAPSSSTGDSLEAYYSGDDQRSKVLFEFILVSQQRVSEGRWQTRACPSSPSSFTRRLRSSVPLWRTRESPYPA